LAQQIFEKSAKTSLQVVTLLAISREKNESRKNIANSRFLLTTKNKPHEAAKTPQHQQHSSYGAPL
jgi:hypothetical protein